MCPEGPNGSVQLGWGKPMRHTCLRERSRGQGEPRAGRVGPLTGCGKLESPEVVLPLPSASTPPSLECLPGVQGPLGLPVLLLWLCSHVPPLRLKRGVRRDARRREKE